MGIFGINERVQKKCENCSSNISTPYHSCIVEVKYLIFTSNPEVDYVDFQGQKVFIKNGDVMATRLSNDCFTKV